VVYPLSMLVNRLGGKVPRSWQHILYWGGLRGALSLALVLSLARDFPYRSALVSATFGVVLFSLLVQGVTVAPLLKRLGLGIHSSQETEFHRLASERLAVQAALHELEQLWVRELFPEWTIKALVEEYRDRLADVERSIAAIGLDERKLAREQQAEARRLALLAEKSMVDLSAQRGWLDEAGWRALAERIDRELTRLQERGPE
jgi:CPA1 family monovalent cation:H+ antiporter